MIAKFIHIGLSVVLLKSYDNVQARHRTENIAETREKRMVNRAYNAHMNSWEAFAAFGIAVLLCLKNKGDSTELSTCCNAFIAIRVAYLQIYLMADNDILAMVRSIAW
eukprot:CAMPEP_0174964176 /NCGR_PEP_ID=MMETSP0004_2-20121128/5734_1 /TAXON_ID=420556 /ORGANISM="Ochromonas sp., Strain CCMP1393" /LENGTH=107 /DNA_ID=CAMNT_0016212871 /DNA_START=87 /DNA_END=407 /DNA_ORIENTATION=-